MPGFLRMEGALALPVRHSRQSCPLITGVRRNCPTHNVECPASFGTAAARFGDSFPVLIAQDHGGARAPWDLPFDPPVCVRE